MTYYGDDLALVHHLGFGFHADACAPGILRRLSDVRARQGLVLEVGCGSGLLTRHLVGAGHRVIASDASPAMLALAREHAPGAEEFCQIRLPEDPLPEADAIVSTGHALNYLPDEAAVHAALVAIAAALRPAGMLALDLCDLEYGRMRIGDPPYARRADSWAIITEYPPAPEGRFIRDMSTFVRNSDGTWRRHDETHHNVLVDTAGVPTLLAAHGVVAEVVPAFGSEELPPGLVVISGRREAG